MPECPSRDDIRSYLEKTLAPFERRRIEEHLSRCPACRALLVELYDERRERIEVRRTPASLKRAVRRATRRRSARRRWIAAGLAAAAILIASGLVVLFERSTPPPGAPTPFSDPVRSPGISGPLALLAPRDGAVVGARGLELRFTPVPGAVRYTVTVLDERGAIVLRESVASERLRIAPEQLIEVVGGELYWYVTARLEDGGELESGMRGFVLTPGD